MKERIKLWILRKVIQWLGIDTEPKVYVYKYTDVYTKREKPISEIKKDFQDGLLRFIERNKLVNLTMKESKNFKGFSFKIYLQDGKK